MEVRVFSQMTLEAYLELERTSEERWEYINGVSLRYGSLARTQPRQGQCICRSESCTGGPTVCRVSGWAEAFDARDGRLPLLRCQCLLRSPRARREGSERIHESHADCRSLVAPTPQITTEAESSFTIEACRRSRSMWSS